MLMMTTGSVRNLPVNDSETLYSYICSTLSSSFISPTHRTFVLNNCHHRMKIYRSNVALSAGYMIYINSKCADNFCCPHKYTYVNISHTRPSSLICVWVTKVITLIRHQPLPPLSHTHILHSPHKNHTHSSRCPHKLLRAHPAHRNTLPHKYCVPQKERVRGNQRSYLKMCRPYLRFYF